MNRRAFVTAAASTALAGCSFRVEPSTPATDDGSEETSVAEFRAVLEDRGVDVDSTLQMGGSLSVMYYRRPEKAEQDLTRIAMAYAEYLGVSEGVLALTALEPDGESRYATYEVLEEWARDYNAGELSRSAYVQHVKDSEVEK